MRLYVIWQILTDMFLVYVDEEFVNDTTTTS